MIFPMLKRSPMMSLILQLKTIKKMITMLLMMMTKAQMTRMILMTQRKTHRSKKRKLRRSEKSRTGLEQMVSK